MIKTNKRVVRYSLCEARRVPYPNLLDESYPNTGAPMKNEERERAREILDVAIELAHTSSIRVHFRICQIRDRENETVITRERERERKRDKIICERRAK